MAEAPKNPTEGQGTAGQPTPANHGTSPNPPTSLSQKADELAARLEAHKNQAQSQVAKEREEAREAAKRRILAANKEAEAKAKSKPAMPAPSTDSVKPVSASAPEQATKEPAAKPEAAKPVEDIIRAIKLPHEIEAEGTSQDQAKPVAVASAQSKAKAESPKVAPTQKVTPVAAVPETGSLPSTKVAVAQARERVLGNHVPEPESSEAAVKRRVARERALNSTPVFGRTAQVIVAVVFPLLTLIAAIRLVATPAFLALSYGRNGFPSDIFGFTDEQRLTYGSYGVDYLNNFAGPEYLAGLKLPTGSSMFTEGEVQHMVDVKNLIGFAYVLGLVLAVILIIGLWYLAKRYAGGVRRALFAGAIVTLVGIAALVVAALLGWQTFFSQFHALFFANGTWTFNVSDTLIRLYPEQYWVDSAIGIAALVVATIVIVLISCWPTARRREAARLRQEARAFGLGS